MSGATRLDGGTRDEIIHVALRYEDRDRDREPRDAPVSPCQDPLDGESIGGTGPADSSGLIVSLPSLGCYSHPDRKVCSNNAATWSLTEVNTER